MSWPWTDKTGLAKATAVLATLLLVSLGLCGANFLVATALMNGKSGAPLALAIITGWAEVLGMTVGVIGLLVVGVLRAWRAVSRRRGRE